MTTPQNAAEWIVWILQILAIPAAIAAWEWWKQRQARRDATRDERRKHDQDADDQIRAAMLHAFEAQSANLETMMRTLVAIQFEIAEGRRDGRITNERTARIETLLATFGPPYQQSGERPWEKREGERE